MFKSSLIILSLSVLCAGATTYRHVHAAFGNDSNGGTATNDSWKTIGKAASTVTADTVVYVWPTNHPVSGLPTNTVYAEKINETTSGTVGGPIIYVAVGHSNVVCQGFTPSGNNVWCVGFEVTHATAVGVAVQWDGTNGLMFHNYIHSVDAGGGGSVQGSGCHRWRVYMNTIAYTESENSTNGVGGGSNYRSIALDNNLANYSVIIGHNWIYQVGDYVNPKGTNWIFRNNTCGPTTVDFAAGAPHVDGLQADGGGGHFYWEFNYHCSNSVNDAHWILAEANNGERGHYYVSLRNASLRVGDQLYYQMRDGTNLYSFHNTVYRVGTGPGRGGPASSGFYRIYAGGQNNPLNCKSFNNAYSNAVTSGGDYYINETGLGSAAFVHGFDVASPAGADLGTSTGDLEVDPLIVNEAIGDLRPQAGSPGVDNGTNITFTTVGVTNGTTFKVEDPHVFHDGFGIVNGSWIYAGTNNHLLVTAVDRGNSNITVSTTITVATNEKVGFEYRGTGPDRGAYEFGDTFLTAATWSISGTTVTVTPTGDAKIAVICVDDVPVGFAERSVGTETYTFNSISVTNASSQIRVYVGARHAQFAPYVLASFDAGGGGGGSSGHPPVKNQNATGGRRR